MHVGLVIYDNLQKVSGGYFYDRTLVEHLRNHGDSVSIISLPWRTYVHHLIDNLSHSLVEKLTHIDLDVLIEDELNHPSCFLLNRSLHKHITYPIVSIVHHLRSLEKHRPWQHDLYRWVERRYLSSVDGFIYNSKDTQHAVEHLIEYRKPWIVAYPGKDHVVHTMTDADIVRRAQQTGPRRFLFLGNVISRKGLHTLLDALEELDSVEWTLTVVGSLTMEKQYARMIMRRNTGFAHRVTYTGIVDDDELVRLFETSHVLVVPSSYEGFGIVYLEGMGFGLPAIASTMGGAREIIRHGEEGFLVDPDDKTSLAHYLRMVCHDQKRLVAMSRAARRRYDTFPTWRETATRIRAFLVSLLNNRNGHVGVA